jgi:hypothetical protein
VKDVTMAQPCSLASIKTEKSHTILVEKPLKKRPLGSPRGKSKETLLSGIGDLKSPGFTGLVSRF